MFPKIHSWKANVCKRIGRRQELRKMKWLLKKKKRSWGEGDYPQEKLKKRIGTFSKHFHKMVSLLILRLFLSSFLNFWFNPECFSPPPKGEPRILLCLFSYTSINLDKIFLFHQIKACFSTFLSYFQLLKYKNSLL